MGWRLVTASRSCRRGVPQPRGAPDPAGDRAAGQPGQAVRPQPASRWPCRSRRHHLRQPAPMRAGGRRPGRGRRGHARPPARPPGRRVSSAPAAGRAFVYLARQLPRAGRGAGRGLRAARHRRARRADADLPRGWPGLAGRRLRGHRQHRAAGLELAYDELLAGEPGRLSLERAPGGLTITGAPREVEPAVAGTDLVLTIDRQIQHAAEEALADARRALRRQGRVRGRLDVATGEVLAMASAPGFDPADLGAPTTTRGATAR
jgi:hypothetical protein